jgi:hypothetical protein
MVVFCIVAANIPTMILTAMLCNGTFLSYFCSDYQTPGDKKCDVFVSKQTENGDFSI